MRTSYAFVAHFKHPPRRTGAASSLQAYLLLGTAFVALTLVQAPAIAQGALNFDADILRVGGIGKDDASLLDFFRHLSPEAIDPDNLGPLVARLNSKKFAERERAARALIHQGMRALPVLQKVLETKDIELVRRARSCIDAIEKPDPGLNIVPAAVRALVKRRVPGAVEALLRYLPFAPAESLEEDVVYGLDALAMRDGKVEPALVAALGDRLAPRRAAAACIVGHRGDARQRAAVRKLMTDPSPLVRLRAAQGLLAGGDGTGLPVLAALVAEPDVPLAWQAEELLHWVAGHQAPEEKVGAGSAEARRKCRAAWEAWCRKRAAAVDFAALLRQPRRPIILIVHNYMDDSKRIPELAVVGCDGRARCQLTAPVGAELAYPVLSRGRLVRIGAQDSQEDEDRIQFLVHHNIRGIHTWNGGLVAVDGDGLQLYGPTGKALWRDREASFRSSNYAWALGNGQLLSLVPEGYDRTNGVQEINRVTLLEVATGKAVRRGKILAKQVTAQALPDGSWRLLVWRWFRPGPGDYRRVLEENDLDGKLLKQWPDQVIPCGRFHNGNDLLLDCSNFSITRFSEVDAQGRVQWEVFRQGRVFEAKSILNLVRLGLTDRRPADLDFGTLSNRIKGLRSPNALERSWTVLALNRLGVKAVAAGPALIEALADPGMAGGAAAALRELGPSVVPHLLKALKHKDSRVRMHAITCLSAYKTEHEVMMPALLEAVKDTDPWVVFQDCVARR